MFYPGFLSDLPASDDPREDIAPPGAEPLDAESHAEEDAIRKRSAELHGDHVFTSVLESDGLADLTDRLRRLASADRPTVEVSVPITDGRTLAEAYREAEVLGRMETTSAVVLTARVPADVLGRWRRIQGVSVQPVSKD